MARRAKPRKNRTRATRPLVRKPPKDPNSKVRDLERRLAEALEQETATAEILRVISRSPINVQPVFEAIATSALRLCDGVASLVFRHDATLIHLVALDSAEGVDTQPLRHIFPTPPDRVTFVRRVVATARLLYIADIEHDRDAPPGLIEFARANGFRSIFAAPMLREGRAIGAIAVTHRDVDGFTRKQGALLETFAAQAVIAIENVRLFTELEARNTELTETLARQMATSEVLRAISQAQADAQPVFEIIAASARRLCGAAYAQVQLYDGELIHLAALDSAYPEGNDAIRAVYPLRVGDGSAGGRAIATCAVTQIPDLLDDRAYAFTSVWQESGLRSLLAVPMLRDRVSVGVIGIGRTEPGMFPHAQIDLLQTFAAQAVIAIENVRLFNETKEALEQQTATADILRVISRSPKSHVGL